jgi:hypothetical protein
MIEKKCPFCKNLYLVKLRAQPNACPLCLRLYFREYLEGRFDPRDEKFESNKEYKDELQGITHRGKVRV